MEPWIDSEGLALRLCISKHLCGNMKFLSSISTTSRAAFTSNRSLPCDYVSSAI
jgi:hypothetical protein